MKKVVLIAGMLFVGAIVTAQTEEAFQAFLQRLKSPHPEYIRQTSNRNEVIPQFEFDITTVPFGQKGVITRVITNPGTSPVTFNFVGHLASDSAFIVMVQAQLSNPFDTARSRVESDKIVREWVKSARWINHNLICQAQPGDTAVFSRKYSPVGTYWSQHSSQCGDFWSLYCHLLFLTGYFTAEDFHDVSVPGHSFGETCLPGWPITAADRANPNSWHMRDVDVATPNVIFADSANPLGYNCVYVTQHAHELAHGGYLWQGQNIATHDTGEYQNLLSQTPTIYAHLEPIRPTGMTSEMKIPAGGTISQSVGPLTAVAVSFTDGSLSALADSVELLMQSGGKDSAATYLSDRLHLPIEDVKNIFINQHILVLVDTVAGLMDGLKYLVVDIPTWEAEFSTDTVENLANICKFPLIYLGGTGDQRIGDTTGNCELADILWRPSQLGPAFVTSREFNYVQEGVVGPGPHHISMAINGNVIFPTEPWDISADGVLQSNTWFEPELVSQVGNTIAKETFRIYPNPATDIIISEQECDLTDIAGKKLMHLTQGVNALNGIAAGTYFAISPSGVVKKIIVL